MKERRNSVFVHLIYAAIYSVLVVSLLISYDLFIKNFKELNLRLSFKILIGVVLFISQVYFIISFSLNSIGYVAYEYTISNLYLLFWYPQRKNISDWAGPRHLANFFCIDQ